MRTQAAVFGAVALLLVVPATTLPRTWKVFENGTGDAPTIQAAVDSSAAGDSVLIFPGHYFERVDTDVSLSFVGQGGATVTRWDADGGRYCLKGTTTLASLALTGLALVGATSDTYGYQGHAVAGDGTATVDECAFGGGAIHWAGPLDVRRSEFVGVPGSLAVLHSEGGPLLLEDCRFHDVGSYGGAVVCTPSDGAMIRRCEFAEAFGFPMQPVIGYSGYETITLEGNVFVGNEVPCVGLFSPVPTLRGGLDRPIVNLVGNTFVRNTSSPVDLFRGSGTIERNLFTGNPIGLKLPENGSRFSVSCNNSWNNGANWSGFPDPTGVAGNFSLPPLYCDAEHGTFTVVSYSPCLPPGNACGVQVGAFGEGCGTVATAPESWAKTKARYR